MKKVTKGLFCAIAIAVAIAAPTFGQTITEDGLSFNISDVWQKVEEKTLENGRSSTYECPDGSAFSITVNPYDESSGVSLSEAFETLHAALRGWNNYIELVSGVTEKNGVTCRTTIFAYEDRPGALYSFYSGKSIVSIFCISSEETSTPDLYEFEKAMENPETESEIEKIEVAEKPDPTAMMRATVTQRVSSQYRNTDVTGVTINEDLGTDAGGDYIILVYLTWNVKNSAKTTKEMLRMYSDDLAATIAGDYPEVNEIAVFWKVPYLTTNNSKWAYERRGDNMYLTDEAVSF